MYLKTPVDMVADECPSIVSLTLHVKGGKCIIKGLYKRSFCCMK